MIELSPGETLKTRIFLTQTEPIVEFLRQGKAISIRAEVGPLIVISDPQKASTVQTNEIDVIVRAPDRMEQNALDELESILAARAKSGVQEYLGLLQRWLSQHAQSPLSPQMHYEFVQGWAGMLDALKRRELKAPDALFRSLRFCLERGAPYSNIVGRDYLEFLYVEKQWGLVELAATRIHQHSRISRLSDSAESYIGSWGALLDTNAFSHLDDAWKERLRAPLLRNLQRSLESGNKYALKEAPRLLARLEDVQTWDTLKKVAQWARIGCSSAVDADRYIDVARQHIQNTP